MNVTGAIQMADIALEKLDQLCDARGIEKAALEMAIADSLMTLKKYLQNSVEENQNGSQE